MRGKLLRRRDHGLTRDFLLVDDIFDQPGEMVETGLCLSTLGLRFKQRWCTIGRLFSESCKNESFLGLIASVGVASKIFDNPGKDVEVWPLASAKKHKLLLQDAEQLLHAAMIATDRLHDCRQQMSRQWI